MNLFELQQRANTLVNKVNEYEEGLTGASINESDILNQHKYADIFSLRPVIKLLFGSSVEEKLSRSLFNNIDLHLFASTAPAWNTSFNMLYIKPFVDSHSNYTTWNKEDILNTTEFTYDELKNYRYSTEKYLKTFRNNLYSPLYSMYYGYDFYFTTSDDITTLGYLLSQEPDKGRLVQLNGAIYATRHDEDITRYKMMDLQPNTRYHISCDQATFKYSTDDINWSLAGSTRFFDDSAAVMIGAQHDGSNPFPGTIDMTKFAVCTPNNSNYGKLTTDLGLNKFPPMFGPVIADGMFISPRRNSDTSNDSTLVNSVRYTPTQTTMAITNSKPSELSTSEYVEFQSQYYYQDTIEYGTQSRLTSTLVNFASNQVSSTSTIVNSGFYIESGQLKADGLSFTPIALPVLSTGDVVELRVRLYPYLYNNATKVKMYAYIWIDINPGTNGYFHAEGLAESSEQSFSNQSLIVNYFESSPYLLLQNLKNTKVTQEQGRTSLDYKSEQHEFANQLDLYNKYNMVQLDVYQNKLTSQSERIPLGINYAYSSNIADALVTESQVANIFNWNTTDTLDIDNNIYTVNRQVPGIVLYYLGAGYDGTYTATIPYSTSKLNSINYYTPPYYGAFYRNQSSDIEDSQVGLDMGAEACRIFIPSMTYTKGQLISPQQIWQPDKLVGDSNIGKGYNWQGGAVYHELVFKNRRQGMKEANLDFIPSSDSVADNDPQGLALRFALAQQKPYYRNRPWFEELNDLYRANAGKLVDAINNSETYEEVVKLELSDFVTKVGDVNVDAAGVASNFSLTNYLKIEDDRLKQTGNEITLHFKTGSVGDEQYIYSTNELTCGPNILFLSFGSNALGQKTTNSTIFTDMIQPDTECWVKVSIVDNNSYTYQYKKGSNEWSTVYNGVDNFSNLSNLVAASLGAPMSGSTSYFKGSIYLLDSGIKFKDSSEMIPFAAMKPISIGHKVSEMTDEEFYKTYKLDYDTWANGLNKPE